MTRTGRSFVPVPSVKGWILARKALSTTFDEDILRELKVAAARLDRPLNQLLEEGARKVLEEVWASDPDTKVFAERRAEAEVDLLDEIEARLRGIRRAGRDHRVLYELTETDQTDVIIAIRKKDEGTYR